MEASVRYSSTTKYRRLPQAPGWDYTDLDNQVERVIDTLNIRLIRPYIVLAIYKRIYYVGDDGYLKLNESLFPHPSIADKNFIIYEHNPLFPAVAVPDTSAEVIITDTLVIPVEEV
jgi:hypothetical protein